SLRREPRRTSLAAPTLPRDVTSGTSRDLPEGVMTRRQADLALLLATALWGTSFVAVKSALADATPFAFLTVRFGLAAFALAPGTRFRPRPAGRELWGGVLLGALVAVGFIAQTAGLVTTTPSRSPCSSDPRSTGRRASPARSSTRSCSRAPSASCCRCGPSGRCRARAPR